MADRHPNRLETLEQLLGSAERHLRAAAPDLALAAVLSREMGAELGSEELHHLAVDVSRLASECRGQRWTALEPGAAAPQQPPLTVEPVARCRCRRELVDGFCRCGQKSEACLCSIVLPQPMHSSGSKAQGGLFFIQCSRCAERLYGSTGPQCVGQEHPGCELGGVWELVHD